jgi:hypoxanthine phosphoribosyltransferase
MQEKIRVLISEEQIAKRVTELADQISSRYSGREVTMICVLKGSFLFFADLVRAMKVPVRVEFLQCSSYGASTTSSGEVKLVLDISTPLDGRHVVIVEDIVDTGLTLKYIRDLLAVRNPASLDCCALLEKPDARTTDVKVEYSGFKIGNEFVVGYGLDFNQLYRELPYVGLMQE